MNGLLAWVGAGWRASYPGQLSELGFRCLSCLVLRAGNRRQSFQQLVSQLYFTGVEAAPLVLLLAMVIGSATILQAASVMPKFGAGDYFGSVMVMVVVREIGPLFTAFLVAGRTGSALATFLGNMRVQSEIDALRTMGIDPVRFLVVPAFLATVVSLFCLMALFNFTALFGGFCVVKFLNLFTPDAWGLRLSFIQYLDRVVASMGPLDGVLAIGKPICFGALISLIACHQGMSVGADVRQVPKATTRSVVNSFAGVILIDSLFALPSLTRLEFF